MTLQCRNWRVLLLFSHQHILFFFLTLTTQLNSADFYSLNIQSKLQVKFCVSTFYIISVWQFFFISCIIHKENLLPFLWSNFAHVWVFNNIYNLLKIKENNFLIITFSMNVSECISVLHRKNRLWAYQ